MLVGLFAQANYADLVVLRAINGLFFGGGGKLLLAQLAGIGSVFAWTFGTMILTFLCHERRLRRLRVSREEELKGLDIEEHGMEAYGGFQIFQND